MYEKPLPIPDAETIPFWTALRHGQLLLKHCTGCRRFHFYPRIICPFCSCDALEWKEASGRGEIYTYTVARRPAGPAFKASVPYVVALVQLDEGPRMMTNIVCDDPNEIRIGLRVAVQYDDVTEDITLAKFRLAQNQPATCREGK